MYPPTPTPLPPATNTPISLVVTWRMWDVTDDIITLWQLIGTDKTQAFQIAILIFMLIGFVALLRIWLDEITETA